MCLATPENSWLPRLTRGWAVFLRNDDYDDGDDDADDNADDDVKDDDDGDDNADDNADDDNDGDDNADDNSDVKDDDNVDDDVKDDDYGDDNADDNADDDVMDDDYDYGDVFSCPKINSELTIFQEFWKQATTLELDPSKFCTTCKVGGGGTQNKALFK